MLCDQFSTMSLFIFSIHWRMCVFGVCDFEHIRFRNPSDGLWPVFARGGGVGLAPAHIVNDPQGYSQNKFFTFISCESSR